MNALAVSKELQVFPRYHQLDVVRKLLTDVRTHGVGQRYLIQHSALQRVLVELLSDHTELFKQFSDNAAFKKWLTETMFSVTYHPPAA